MGYCSNKALGKMKCSILVNLIGLSFFLIKQAYPGKLTHSCSLVLCLVIVLWALIHLTEFALNEKNWQIGRKKPMLPNHQLRILPEGKLVPRPVSVKNDIMMLGFK